MRKIEQWMLDTIRNQRGDSFDGYTLKNVNFEACNDNTRVTTRTREDGKLITSVYLYGNLIAQLSQGENWGFKMCGWNTPTTRSRINALAGMFGQPVVC